LLLGIDTSTRLAALALFEQEKGLIAESRFGLSLAHSETLMPNLDVLLASVGMTLPDLSGIAVARGPGSFTGLRVALATAKGLAFATGIPIYPVSTLEAMTYPHAFSAITLCPMLYARKNEVYAALYRPDSGRLVTVLSESALHPRELMDRIEGPVLFLGNGSDHYRSLIDECLGDAAYFVPPSLSLPSAVSVCELALQQYVRPGVAPPDAASVTPLYLRPSEAELKWTQRTLP